MNCNEGSAHVVRVRVHVGVHVDGYAGLKLCYLVSFEMQYLRQFHYIYIYVCV